MQTQSHTSFAKVLACAALALFVAAPAALADRSPTAPGLPERRAVAAGGAHGPRQRERRRPRPGALLRVLRRAGSAEPAHEPADDGGVDWAAIGIGLGATVLLLGAVIALLMRTRRRTGRARVVA